MTIPRIGYDRLPEALSQVLRARVERLGYLGEFFQCTAHQPGALAHFIGFTEALKDALPADVVEVVALTAAVTVANDYERNQHQRLCLALGFDETWIADVEAGARGTGPALDEPLGTVQRYVTAACQPGGHDPATALSEVAALLGAEQAVAVALTAGRYVAHALVVRSLGLQPPVPAVIP